MTNPVPLTTKLEAVLFVASEPLSADRLSAAVQASLEETKAALGQLSQHLRGGIVLSELDGRYRLVSAPGAGPTVRQFLQDESKSDLSRAALETLAIVAYRGPVTKSAIEAIRGVASEAMLRNLLARGLIREAGKSAEPGKPQLYSVSHTFLQHFGLTSPTELPPLPSPEPVESEHAN